MKKLLFLSFLFIFFDTHSKISIRDLELPTICLTRQTFPPCKDWVHCTDDEKFEQHMWYMYRSDMGRSERQSCGSNALKFVEEHQNFVPKTYHLCYLQSLINSLIINPASINSYYPGHSTEFPKRILKIILERMG